MAASLPSLCCLCETVGTNNGPTEGQRYSFAIGLDKLNRLELQPVQSHGAPPTGRAHYLLGPWSQTNTCPPEPFTETHTPRLPCMQEAHLNFRQHRGKGIFHFLSGHASSGNMQHTHTQTPAKVVGHTEIGALGFAPNAKGTIPLSQVRNAGCLVLKACHQILSPC